MRICKKSIVKIRAMARTMFTNANEEKMDPAFSLVDSKASGAKCEREMACKHVKIG